MALTLAQVREQYPQYSSMSDDALARALHTKFYSSMPFEEFGSKVGYKPDFSNVAGGFAGDENLNAPWPQAEEQPWPEESPSREPNALSYLPRKAAGGALTAVGGLADILGANQTGQTLQNVGALASDTGQFVERPESFFDLQTPLYVAEQGVAGATEFAGSLLAPGGAIGRLASMGGQVFGANKRELYEQALNDYANNTDLSREEIQAAATEYADTHAGAKTAYQLPLEFLPYSRMFGRAGGGGAVSNVMRGGGEEALTEVAQTAADLGYDVGVLGQEAPTLAEAARQMVESGGAGFAGGTAVAGGIETATALGGRRSTSQEGASPPTPITPETAQEITAPIEQAIEAIATDTPIEEAVSPVEPEVEAPTPTYNLDQATQVIDQRIAALEEASTTGRLDKESVKRLAQEEQDLVDTLREYEARVESGSLPADPTAILTPDEIDFITNRRNEIRVALETNRASRDSEKQLQRLQRRLEDVDDTTLLSIAEELAPPPRQVDQQQAIQEELEAGPMPTPEPTGTISRVQTQAEVLAQMEDEGTLGNGARFQELMAERGFGETSTQRPLEAPTARAQGTPTVPTPSTPSLATEPYRASQGVSEGTPAPEPTSAPEGEAVGAKAALQQLKDEGRVGDVERFKEIMGAPQSAAPDSLVDWDSLSPTEQKAFQAMFDKRDTEKAERELSIETATLGRQAAAQVAREKGLDKEVETYSKATGVGTVYAKSIDDLDGLVKPEFLKGSKQGDTKRAAAGANLVRKGTYYEGSMTVSGKPLMAIYPDSHTSPKEVRWTAAHELAGHHGLRTLVDQGKDGTYKQLMERASQNPVVAKIAAQMGSTRKSADSSLMVEEALAELNASLRSGDTAKLQEKYGVDFKASNLTALRAFVDRIINALKSIVGKGEFSNAQVEQLLNRAWEAAQSTAKTQEAPRKPADSVESAPDAELSRYAAIAKRMAEGKPPLTPETKEARKQAADDRTLVRNVRQNLISQFPNANHSSPEFNETVARKVVDIKERRQRIPEATGTTKAVLEAQTSPQGFTPLAKKVLKRQTQAGKLLKTIFSYTGALPKEAYRNMIEKPNKKADGTNRLIEFIMKSTNKAMGKNTSPELAVQFIKAITHQPNTLNPKQLAAVKEDRAAVDSLLLQLADAASEVDSPANQAIVESALAGVGNMIIGAYRKNHYRKPWAFFSKETPTESFLALRKKEAPDVVQRALDTLVKNYTIPSDIQSAPDDVVLRLAETYGVKGKGTETIRGGLERILNQFKTDTNTIEEAQANLIETVKQELFSPSAPSAPLLQATRDARKNPLTAYSNLEPEIKAAWGEYANPALIVGSTMSRIAGITAKIRAYNWLATEGVSQGFVFNERPAGTQWKQLDGTYGSLEGKWVNPTIKDALDTVNNVTQAGDANYQMWQKALVNWGRANSIPKLMKTGLSLPAIITQAASNAGLVAGEMIGGGKPADALKAVSLAFKDVFGTNDKNNQLLMAKLVEVGALRDGVTLGELKGLIRKLERKLSVEASPPATRAIGKAQMGFSNAMEAIGDFYQITDNVPKVFGYFNAVKRLQAIYPDKSQQEIMDMAGDMVMDYYPTFSRAFPIVKAASRLAGNYATWPGETARTLIERGKGIAKFTKEAKRLGDTPEGRAAASYARLLATGTGASLAAANATLFAVGGTAAAALAALIPGDEPEEEKMEKLEESLSALTPEWLQNTALVPIGMDRERHRIVVVDQGRVDPFGPPKEMGRALNSGGPWGLAQQMGKTFLGPGPLLSGIIETATGESMLTGQPQSRSQSIANALAPGQLLAYDRYLKNVNAGGDPEALYYAMMGAPLRELDGVALTRSKLYEFRGARDENRADIDFVFKQADPVPKEAVEALAVQWLQRDKEAWNNARAVIQGAQYAFGMDEEALVEAAKNKAETGVVISNAMLGSLLDGEYQPTPPSNKYWNGMITRLQKDNRGIEGSAEAIEAEVEARAEAFNNIIDNWEQYISE